MAQQDTSENKAFEPNLDNYTDLTVGEILRRTREHYNQSLGQVEANLRIRASQLHALETGDLSTLPGRVYAIGFVRAYAEYLGLDGNKMVHLFKAQSVGKRVKPELQFPVTYEESKTPNMTIILGALVGLILLIGYWTMTYAPAKQVEAIPPVPEALKQGNITLLKPQVAEAVESITQDTAPEAALLTEITALKEISAPKGLELIIFEDSWIEIKDAAGKKLISQVLKPGDKYIVPKDQQGLLLSTGNAGGITVFVDGKKFGTLGDSAQVKRNIDLDIQNFSKTAP